MSYLQKQIEALIFCAPSPIKVEEIQRALEELLNEPIKKSDIRVRVSSLIQKYDEQDSIFGICEIGGGYQFLSKPAYNKIISIWLKQKSKRKLSRTALETLALIAYKQPVTKADIERIRGVSADYAFQRLLEKELISIKGKARSPGRPLLYGTSEKFMHYFGINSIDDLPLPEELDFPAVQLDLANTIDNSQPTLFDQAQNLLGSSETTDNPDND